MNHEKQRYVKKLNEEIADVNTHKNMVQKRLSDGAKRHLPIIRHGNMSNNSTHGHEDYISPVPSNELNNRANDIFFASKKDIARRHLMGYLYTRQPTISRSNSFIVGEKPPEPGLPTVKFKNTPKGFERQRTLLLESRRPPSIKRNQVKSREDDRHRSAGSGRPDSNRFSLPEIMRDIYSSAAKLESPEEVDENSISSQGNSIDIAEDLTRLDLPKYHKSVKFYPPNYRPITPGLIEKLNKRKVPTKNRTEQWLRTMPEDPRKCQENRTRGLSTGAEASSRWIYTDNS